MFSAASLVRSLCPAFSRERNRHERYEAELEAPVSTHAPGADEPYGISDNANLHPLLWQVLWVRRDRVYANFHLTTSQQEELWKEIRALKGLVLSRYSSSAVVCGIGLLTYSILQAYFRHPKGFIRHEHAPTMIYDTSLQSIDETFSERELAERLIAASAGVGSSPHPVARRARE
jgi:hypothetical protein